MYQGGVNPLKYKEKKLKSRILGFTLIELLAVIVILAIIALITVPIVLNIINDTKMSAFKRNIESYMSSVELMLSKPELDNIDSSTCTIEKDKIICTEKEYSIEID